ncbi:hypothetical protein AX16_004537 [Volvariella volvacea WC 439]|nr:hypothetical protein AX16_004537 [Volvariella volvacea WC 439]
MPHLQHAVGQRLVLGNIAEGLTFNIVSWEKWKPNNDWPDPYPSIYKSSVTSANNGACIGVSVLYSKGIFGFSSGQGTRTILHFTITGTTKGGLVVNEEGTITFGSTDWNTLSRPSYSTISYVLKDAAPQTLSIAIPTLTSQSDAKVIIAVEEETKQIGFTILEEVNFINKYLNKAIDGIFWIHGSAFKAVLKVIPLPK